MNEYINLTLENIDEEHICCAIGVKKHQAGVDSKKEWLKSKLKDGHVFRKLNARTMKIDNQDFTIYYSNECPYVEYEVNELTKYAKKNNIKINFTKVDSLEKAKNVPCIFNNWANFYKGEFISNTILNANSFEKLIK